jgi:hypothetical protein
MYKISTPIVPIPRESVILILKEALIKGLECCEVKKEGVRIQHHPFSFCLYPSTLNPVFWLSAGGIPAFASRLDPVPLHPHPVLPEHLSLLRLL